MKSAIKIVNSGNSGACAVFGVGEESGVDELGSGELLVEGFVGEGSLELVGDDEDMEVGAGVGVTLDVLGPTTIFALVVVQGIVW